MSSETYPIKVKVSVEYEIAPPKKGAKQWYVEISNPHIQGFSHCCTIYAVTPELAVANAREWIARQGTVIEEAGQGEVIDDDIQQAIESIGGLANLFTSQGSSGYANMLKTAITSIVDGLNQVIAERDSLRDQLGTANARLVAMANEVVEAQDETEWIYDDELGTGRKMPKEGWVAYDTRQENK